MRRRPLIELLKSRYPNVAEKELAADVMRGGVLVNGEPVLKPGFPVPEDADLRRRARPAYVSRGGDKLAAALDAWSIPCAGAVWLDAGCSTGGFTDCLLSHGAAAVHAVDVGVGQLAWRLRGDARVIPHEGVNVMTLDRSALAPVPVRAAADLSFRSLRGAARHVLSLAVEGWGIFLVKPQFELPVDTPGFHGVVADAGTVRDVLARLVVDLAAEGVSVERAIPSPLRGRKGNREFLFLLRLGCADGAHAMESAALEALVRE